MVQLTKKAERSFARTIAWSRDRTLADGLRNLTELEAFRPVEQAVDGDFTRSLSVLCLFGSWSGPLFEATIWGDPASAWALIARQASYLALACGVAWPKRVGAPRDVFSHMLDSIVRRRPHRVRGAMDHCAARLDARANQVWLRATDLHFAAWLGNQHLGDEVVANERLDLGAYASVAAHWNDPDFESALVEALEYHLGSMGAGANDGDTYTGTFALVPIEFEAMRVVRERAGLPMPTLDHPFFKTPFAEYGRSPGEFDPRSDPRFCAIVERAKRDGIVPEGVDLFAV